MTYDAIKRKWAGFGWHCMECDGHDIENIITCLNETASNMPKAILAKTVKGKGISFMENNNDWHHNRLSQKLFDLAVEDLKK